MFDTLAPPPRDSLLAIMQAFREDGREGKVDLGVGIYMDAAGRAPVMRAVKAAERRLAETEETKAYLGSAGSRSFAQSVEEIIFSDAVPPDRLQTLQTAGGSAALRLAGEVVAPSRVWLGVPSWVNHAPGQRAAGNSVLEFNYLGSDGRFDVGVALEGLRDAQPQDVVIFQASCHNPCGRDPGPEDWARLADFISERRLIPLIDNTYQGLGAGLDEDAAGLRALVKNVPKAIVTTSFSKNFALYRERVGALSVIGADADATRRAFAAAQSAARVSYSMPPNHGAAVVDMIWRDETLRDQWLGELAEMRARLVEMRDALHARLSTAGARAAVSVDAGQRGMFAWTGLGESQVSWLRDAHAIYLAPDGRLNLAGLGAGNLDRVAEALRAAEDRAAA